MDNRNNNNQTYTAKDYKQLKTDSLIARRKKLEKKICELEKKHETYKNYTGIIAPMMVHKYNVKMNVYAREIQKIEEQLQNVSTMTEEQILNDEKSKKQYEKYDEKVNEIFRQEGILDQQITSEQRMSEGRLKEKAKAKVAKTEKKIAKLKKKAIKMQNKQVSRMVRKDVLNNFKKIKDVGYSARSIQTKIAERDTLRQENTQLRATRDMTTNFPNIIFVKDAYEKGRKGYYNNIVKHRVKKIKKLNKELEDIREKRCRALGGNPRTIPQQRRQRPAGPTR